MNGRALFIAFRARSLVLVILGLCTILGWQLLARQIRPVTVSITEQVAGKVVLIDPGHGGRDPGAVAPSGLLEKDVTLGVALHLERLLHRAAVHVVMTRRDDSDLSDAGTTNRKVQDLSRRVQMARDTQADLFVSIHANSFPSPVWSGAQTFYYPGRADDRWLAEKIQARLKSQLGPNRREAAAADYYVLRESTVPAVVVEVGFLSHPKESELLGSPDYQQRIAEAIYMGIIDYFALPRPSEVPATSAAETGQSLPVPQPHAANEVLLYYVSPVSEELTAVIHRFSPSFPSMSLSDRIRMTLHAFLSGPPAGHELLSVIPPAVTVRMVSIDTDLLTVDFSSQIRDGFTGGFREERLIIDSLLYTLAQFDEIGRVRFLIDGDAGTSIGGHIRLGEPFDIPKTQGLDNVPSGPGNNR